MSNRKRKFLQSKAVEPENLNTRIKKESNDTDDSSNSPFLQESTDNSDLPPGSFLKLEWHSENSSTDQEPSMLRTMAQEDEAEDSRNSSGEDEENELYVNYSMLTDQLISGHFLSGATAEEVHVFNDESPHSKKAISDLLSSGKFKCHHCNLRFVSHLFYKNHLKKCAVRRTYDAKTGNIENNNSISDNFNNRSNKRKLVSNVSNRNVAKSFKSGNQARSIQQFTYEEESNCSSVDDCFSSEEELNICEKEILKSHANFAFKCDSCKCLFNSLIEMKDHVCFKNTEHQCDMCLTKCPTKTAFYEHLERFHRIKINSILSGSSKTFPVQSSRKQFVNTVVQNDAPKNMSNNVFLLPLYIINGGKEFPRKS